MCTHPCAQDCLPDAPHVTVTATVTATVTLTVTVTLDCVWDWDCRFTALSFPPPTRTTARPTTTCTSRLKGTATRLRAARSPAHARGCLSVDACMDA